MTRPSLERQPHVLLIILPFRSWTSSSNMPPLKTRASTRAMAKETVDLPQNKVDSDSEHEEEEESSSEEEDEGDYDEDDDSDNLASSVESNHEFDLKDVSDDEQDQTEVNDTEDDIVLGPTQDAQNEKESSEPHKGIEGAVVRNEMKPKGKSGTVAQVDEYAHDSSDEEDLRNTVGNIPIQWYDNYDHIGYDSSGMKIIKPRGSKTNEVDEFMRKIEDPYFWRTVKDKFTGENVILTDGDADVVKRVKKGLYPDANYDPYPDFIDFFTYEKMIHPVTNRPEHKASFIPSLSEKKMISRLVSKIKRKWQDPKVDAPVKKEEPFDFGHDLWETDADPLSRRQATRRRRYIPAPKLRPPDHRESYNPPPEFCASKEAIAKWKAKDPDKRHFLPQQFPNLRSVPAYAPFVKERFDRCLDLYLCPRVRRMKADVDPEDLIPKLPRPKELQPFPSQLAIIFKGHEDVVRSISIEPFGQFVASGSDDKTVKIWEVLTGRCFKTFTFDEPVTFVSWNPSSERTVIAVTTGKDVVLLNPGVGDKKNVSTTDELFEKLDEGVDNNSKGVSQWKHTRQESQQDWKDGKRIVITHSKAVSQIAWHIKGDYFAVVMPDGGNRSVIIHQLSKKRSQIPFSKSNGRIQSVLFHPTRPYFVIATQKTVRVYNLIKQELSKKLLPGCNMISSMAIHSGGDNVIVGTFDNRLPWFDLDLSDKPYKTMRYHKKAIRSVDFHAKYPLFASAGDDGTIVVSHGMVYNDLTQNALIVPVKILKGHAVVEAVGVTACKFHPQHPWIMSSGADKTVRLFT